MNELLDEAQRLPAASVKFARGVSYVKPPDHLRPLRDRVHADHRGALLAVHEAINRRFGTTGAQDDYVNVFYAASEMAVMERAFRDELTAEDRHRLRELWDVLLSAS